MHLRLIESVAATFSLRPEVVAFLLGPHLKDVPDDAAELSDIHPFLSPAVAHHLRYNLSSVTRGQKVFDLVNRFLPEREGLSVLDIGAGFGGMLLPFGQRGFDLHGIEPDPVRLRMCQHTLASLGLGATFHAADLCKQSLDGRLFDVIVCNSVIEHVSDPQAMIERMGTMLAPGGVLYFGVANKDAIGNVIADPHYAMFGLTLFQQGPARRFFDLFVDAPLQYGVTEFFSVECYLNLLRSEVGPLHLAPDPERRTIRAFPDLLARLTAGFGKALKSGRMAKHKLLERQFEQAFTRYLSRVAHAYDTAIETGTQRQFTETYIRKSHHVVAGKTEGGPLLQGQVAGVAG